jgi:hypothetical protein
LYFEGILQIVMAVAQAIASLPQPSQLSAC